MTTHTETPLPLTSRAFDAIVAQMTARADLERSCCATINGAEIAWTAFFEIEADPYAGMNERHEVCAYTRCKLVGAWAENGETGQLYAGNRDEISAALGDAVVAEWEQRAEQGANA